MATGGRRRRGAPRRGNPAGGQPPRRATPGGEGRRREPHQRRLVHDPDRPVRCGHPGRFAAVRWRRAEDLLHLNEWGLGGRGFGTFVTWFLLGGDLYTAYTFIAVPALVYGDRRGRLLRGVLHDHGLPDRVRVPAPAVVGRAPGARLRHPGRLRPRPVRLARAGAGRGPHRHPGHDALHRPAAGRHPGGADRDGRRREHRVRQGPAADHRVRRAGRLHLRLRACAPRR